LKFSNTEHNQGQKFRKLVEAGSFFARDVCVISCWFGTEGPEVDATAAVFLRVVTDQPWHGCVFEGRE
jgi:hypothetical protein